MKIINEYPPNIKKIKERFDVPRNAIFTYGDAIYNPHGVMVDEPLMRHEENHVKQQGDDPDGWWDKYLTDNKFRLKMELECYRIQYKSAKTLIKDREILNRYVHTMVSALSSPMYGNIISYQDATKLIKQ